MLPPVTLLLPKPLLAASLRSVGDRAIVASTRRPISVVDPPDCSRRLW
jgi:hypothetical protein